MTLLLGVESIGFSSTDFDGAMSASAAMVWCDRCTINLWGFILEARVASKIYSAKRATRGYDKSIISQIRMRQGYIKTRRYDGVIW